MAQEVYPNIFLIKEKGSFGMIKPPENIYVLAGDDGLIFDAGYGDKKTVKRVVNQINEIRNLYQSQNRPFNITRIMPSHVHPDHFSGLFWLRKMLGIEIMATKTMAEIIRSPENFEKSFRTDDAKDYFILKRSLSSRLLRKLGGKISGYLYYRMYGIRFIEDPDKIIEQNTEISINGETWKIFHSPGHSIDHVSLYNENKGILFSGDNVLRTITTWLGPPNSNIEDYVMSVQNMLTLPNLKIILPAHGSPIKDPIERISDILKHRAERKKQVLNLIYENGEKGISPSQIIQALYSRQRSFFRGVAKGWVCLTLKMLEKENLIRSTIGKKEMLFSPIN